MKIAIVTGSAGLVGSEAIGFLAGKFDKVIGIDNNYREVLFGKDASVSWNMARLRNNYANYIHYSIDIRDRPALERLFDKYRSDIHLIIHAAAS